MDLFFWEDDWVLFYFIVCFLIRPLLALCMGAVHKVPVGIDERFFKAVYCVVEDFFQVGW